MRRRLKITKVGAIKRINTNIEKEFIIVEEGGVVRGQVGESLVRDIMIIFSGNRNYRENNGIKRGKVGS